MHRRQLLQFASTVIPIAIPIQISNTKPMDNLEISSVVKKERYQRGLEMLKRVMGQSRGCLCPVSFVVLPLKLSVGA